MRRNRCEYVDNDAMRYKFAEAVISIRKTARAMILY